MIPCLKFKDINKKGNILILGAGPSGMAAAFELDKAGSSFIIIEKNGQIGGLARTLQFGEFRTDIGPHRFFSQNQYLYNLIEDLLGKQWIKVERLTRFYINGKFFYYPVRIKNILKNIEISRAFRILYDYLLERIKSRFPGKELKSFEDYIISEFGRELAQLNMINYTEKIWGLRCSEISLDWAKQRIEGLSLSSTIKKTFIKSKQSPKTLVEQFYYPRSGSGLIYEKIKERILNSRDTFKLNSYPARIFHNNKKITEIIVNVKGNEQIIMPEYIISSIPATDFIGLLEPGAPREVLEAVKKLKFRSHVSLFITLNKLSVFQDHWIYFPEKEIPFGRIMEPRNFSEKMSPPGKTSLLIEFFCWEGDTIWNKSKKELFELSIEWLGKLGFIKRDEVIDTFVHREKYAYPVYNLNYGKYLRTVKEFLERFENLQVIGRSGSFRYNNQDHAMEMGISAARNIIARNN